MSNIKQTRLNEKEAHEVVRLRVPVVYTAIKQEGEDELSRSPLSLWWSGVGAGLAIFLSVVVTGALNHHLDYGALIHLGYAVGFLIVILGRLQLFTENTITAVIPLLSSPNKKTLNVMLRLWGIVFIANMVGVLIAATATIHGNIFSADITQGIIDISRHYAHREAFEFFLQGIPAGFIVAALVWMLPSSHGSEFWVITMMTYIISLTGLTHVIAGSGEMFVVMLLGEISVFDTIVISILPTLIGNVIGGTALFAMLAYGQVKEEI
jgi:formate/nitrite transporter FocA (FNT family)